MCWSNCPNKCLGLDVLDRTPGGPPFAPNRSLSLTKTSLWKTTGIDIFPPFSRNQVTHDRTVTAPLASSWSRCWIPGNPEVEKRTGSNGVFAHPVLKRCGSGWWMLGCFAPLPPSEEGGKDMDPGENLINLSRFKKLRIKKPESRRREMAKSSSGGRSVDCFICQGVYYPFLYGVYKRQLTNISRKSNSFSN